MIGQIHDSVLLDVHPDEMMHVLDMVRSVTCNKLQKHWDWIIVPLEIEAEAADVDQSWYHKKEVVV